MAKEAFVLASISKPEFEAVDGDIFYTSVEIEKGAGKDRLLRFQQATQGEEVVTFKFYTHLGYQLEAPITALSVSEYDDSHAYDVLDIYVRLTPKQLAKIIPPKVSAEFGY